MSCGILIVLGTAYGLFQENSTDFAEEALEIRGSQLDRIMTLCILPDFSSSRCYIVETILFFLVLASHPWCDLRPRED